MNGSKLRFGRALSAVPALWSNSSRREGCAHAESMRIVECSDWSDEEGAGWQSGEGYGRLQSRRVTALDVFKTQETKSQQGLAYVHGLAVKGFASACLCLN